MTFLFVILVCLFVLFIYFVPSFIAISRKHTYSLQITLLNALLGWSFFGWTAALIWATTDHIDENINNKLSWVIISIFWIAVLFPVMLMGGFLSLASYELETDVPHVKTIEYKIINFKLVPEKEDSLKDDKAEKSQKSEDAEAAEDAEKTVIKGIKTPHEDEDKD